MAVWPRVDVTYTDVSECVACGRLALVNASQSFKDWSSPVRHLKIPTADDLNVTGAVVLFGDTVKLLGFSLDSDLTTDWCVTIGVLRSCNYHSRGLQPIRPLLTLNAAKMITHSVVSSRPDYTNTLLHDTLAKLPSISTSWTHWPGWYVKHRLLSASRSYADYYTGSQSANK